MPHILFCFNVPKLSDCLLSCTYAYYIAQRKISILCADETQRAAVDRALWVHPQHFLPHVPAHSPWANDTPIILDLAPTLTPADVCMNLAKYAFSSPIPYTRIVEFVTQDDAEKIAGRQRYRRWQQLGCPIDTQDVTQPTHQWTDTL